MARKSGTHKARKSTAAVAVDKTVSLLGRWSWLLSFVLLVSVAQGGPFQTVRVLPPRVDSLLAPEWAWEPPLLWLSSLQSIAECPYWLYAAVMSLLIAQFLGARSQAGRSESSELGIEFILLAALSLPVLPVDLATAAIVIGAANFLVRPCRVGRTRGVSSGLVILAVAAVLVCVDFSLVLLMLLAGWLKHFGCRLSLRRNVFVLAGFVSAWGLGMFCIPGFAAAFARPLTWWAVAEKHLPMTPVLSDDFFAWIPIGLSVVVVIHAWYLAWAGNQRNVATLFPLLVFSLLSLTCRYYHWVALVGVVSCSDYAVSGRRVLLPSRWLRWSLVPIVLLIPVVLLIVVPQLESYRSFALTGRWPRQFVDPAEWGTSGRVMLMQPEYSSRWQTNRLRESFSLIVDDRWDVFAGEYRNYQLVCRDLSEFRSSRYVRSDGGWGGYKQWTEQWEPTLLVVDSSDLDGIRRLSVSPDWTVVGIDSRRTILAAAGDPKNSSQVRKAAQILSGFEWPSRQFDGSFGNVLAASGSTARVKVARVLLALRLPYAALRLMPETTELGGELSAKCYFEISHRVFRHTQTHSLLDQYRALYHLRQLVESNRLPAKQLIRVARGLEELNESAVAIEFATQLTEQSGSGIAQEQQWAKELIARCKPAVADESEVDTATPDTLIRRALLSGDQTAVAEALKTLTGREREFFQVLAGAISNSPEDVYLELIALLNSADFPNQLRGEALFYLGSLAIEVGDSQSAVNAFSAIIQAAPSQPLNSISRVSLMNLQKRSR
ncbi:MAG: hypothetical protein ACKVHE_00020 [Planctomycetales bacterium]|jgi:hypothetical protein